MRKLHSDEAKPKKSSARRSYRSTVATRLDLPVNSWVLYSAHRAELRFFADFLIRLKERRNSQLRGSPSRMPLAAMIEGNFIE